MKGSKEDPQQVLALYYYAYLYGGRGYGRSEDGDETSLPRIQRDAIAKFYDTYYAPGNMILAVAGDFQAADMKKKLEDTLGAWPAKQTPAVKIEATTPAKGERLLLIDKPDATQTYFAFGNIGIAAGDPDRVAIRVVNTVFGERFTSMLNEALRIESGLTYGAQAGFDPRKLPGPFVIESFTKNETTTQAIDLALQVLAKLHKDGLTADQLKSAKNYIKGQFPPEIETSGALARRIASNEFYGLDDNEVNQLEARIDAVTLETARQVIQKHYPFENLVFALINLRPWPRLKNTPRKWTNENCERDFGRLENDTGSEKLEHKFAGNGTEWRKYWQVGDVGSDVYDGERRPEMRRCGARSARPKSICLRRIRGACRVTAQHDHWQP